jgi:hypothetical protein
VAPSPAASATSSTLHNQDQQPGTTANAEPAANALYYGSCLQQGSCAAAGEHNIPAYDLDKLVEESSEALDIWAGFCLAIHDWGDGAAILCLLLFILKLLGDIAIISMAAIQGGLRVALNVITQVFLYPSLYRKALARAKAKCPKSQDY